MRIIPVLLIMLMLSSCHFIRKEGDSVKVYGSPKENALDTLQKTEQVSPEQKKDLRFFGK